ncbi:ribonuclease H-like domain-containing protein, partial [Ephemerocybe angulata]
MECRGRREGTESGRGEDGEAGVAVSAPVNEKHVPRPRRRKFQLSDETELDRLMIAAIESKAGPDQALRRIYGPVYLRSSEVHVYVDGSSIANGTPDARAGSGVFFGPGSRKNLAVRVPDELTNGRAEVYAILCALRAVNDHQSLVIYSDSVYALGMLTVWASKKAAIGWRVTNGDLFRDIVALIERRPASVTFRKVKAHSGNAHNDGADELAKAGA